MTAGPRPAGGEPLPAGADAEPLLAGAGVTRRFGSVTAVADVSLAVLAGEVVGLLGANGAGKTTLIRVLLGLLAPTSGRVRLLSGPPTRARRAQVGYVPQGLGLYLDLTARENLQFAAQAYRRPTAAVPEDLADHLDTLVRDLPLGTQRRLAFRCALQHDPALLVLDEPTSGVDPLARARLWDTVRDQADRGAGVLVTTHNLQEAQQCDRLLVMADARIVAAGSESDVIAGTTAVEVRTPDWAAAFAALEDARAAVTLAGRTVRVADGDPERVAGVLAAAGVPAEVARVPATLEETMTVLTRGGAGPGRAG